MMQRTRVLYSGHVQGVGFRATTRGLAGNYDVVGYVKNLSDGRVELLVEGDKTDIAALLKAVERELGRHISDRVRHDETILKPRHSSFDIAR